MESANESDRGPETQGETATEMGHGDQRCATASAAADDPTPRTPTLPPTQETTTTAATSQRPMGWTNQAGRFNDGDSPANPFQGVSAAAQLWPQLQQASQAPVKPSLGGLHKRRAFASPEKFNAGAFEPSPLHIDTSSEQEPARKRARLENKVEITYDSTGTPRIASVTPTLTLPSGRIVSATYLLNRRRPTPTLTPQQKKKAFSVIDGLLRHNDLLLLLTSYLIIPSLISLYSISKPFHMLFNRHPTAFILSCMRTWAPNADMIYPWRCYQSLCVKDPVLRQKAQYEGIEVQFDFMPKGADLRDTPSLKWLQMVVWREGISKDILIQLATKGLRCPPGTHDAVKRLWFILDLPLNAHRIALIRSEAYIPKPVLTRATAFLLKLDMHFTNPSGPIYNAIPPGFNPRTVGYPANWQSSGFVGCDLRGLLLAERTLTPLWRVLRGMSWDPSEPNVPMNNLDILRLWVRHKYRLRPDAPAKAKTMPIMGVPWWEVGTASLERTSVSIFSLGEKQCVVQHPALTGPNPTDYTAQQLLYPHRKRLIAPTPPRAREPLLRPDQLVQREAIRRRMEMHRHWTRMMLWGFSDDLGRALPLRTEEELLRWSRGEKPLHLYKTDRQVLEEREILRRGREMEGEQAGKAESGENGETAGVEAGTLDMPAPPSAPPA